MTTRSRAIWIAFIGLIVSRACLAECMPIQPPGVSKKVAFATAAIDSLGKFQEAQSTLASMGKATNGTDMLMHVYEADDALTCASRMVKPFANAADKGERGAAQILMQIAKDLEALNKQSKRFIVAELNGDLSKEKQGDHADRMARLGNLYNQTWKMLPTASTITFMALLEPYGKKTKRMRLALTEADRRAINAHLAETFPSIRYVSKGQELSQPQLAASVLSYGLNKKGFTLRPTR